MKVTRKLILGIALVLLTVTLVTTALRINREREVFREDTVRDHDFIGRVLRAAWLDVWDRDGTEAADAMIADVDAAAPEVHVRARIDGDCWEHRRGGTERTLARSFERAGEAVSCYPVRAPDGTERVIEVRESLRPRQRFIHESMLRNTLIGLISVLVSTLVTALLGAHFVGAPVRALRRKAQRVGAGDLSGPLVLRQHDEIAELAAEFNAMCTQLREAQLRGDEHHRASLQAIEQLRHADRLRTAGQLASGLAHELGTPLNVILGRAGLLSGAESTPEEIDETSRVIAEQTRKMTALIRQLLDFARRKGPAMSPAPLAGVVDATVSLLRPMAQKADVRVDVDADPRAVANIDAGQIQQVLSNLMVNAMHAMPGGGHLVVRAGKRELHPPPDVGSDDTSWNFIAVEDDGTGIATEDLARVFEPFFTTKGVGEGTGLGLSVAYTIARDHGGWIIAERRPDRGSRFTLFLPVATGSDAAVEQ